MKLEEAIKILELHNKWRRNNDEVNPYRMQNPSEIGIAIDVVIRAAKEHQTLSMVMSQIAEKQRNTKEQRMANACVIFLESMR